MLLTVITICFNDYNGLKRTLQSVLKQVDVDGLFEHLVIDGDSKDGTKEYLKFLNYNHISEPDSGIYDAFNKGIETANGQYITFLNAGDELAEISTLKSYINTIKKNSQDIIWFQNRHLTSDGRVLRRTAVTENAMKYLRIMPPHQACVYKKELFTENLYDIDFKIAGDYDWFIRNFIEFKFGAYIPLVTVNQFYGGVSNNGFQSLLKSNKEVFNVLAKHQSMPIFWISIKLIYKFLLKCRSQIFSF